MGGILFFASLIFEFLYCQLLPRETWIQGKKKLTTKCSTEFLIAKKGEDKVKERGNKKIWRKKIFLNWLLKRLDDWQKLSSLSKNIQNIQNYLHIKDVT